MKSSLNKRPNTKAPTPLMPPTPRLIYTTSRLPIPCFTACFLCDARIGFCRCILVCPELSGAAVPPSSVFQVISELSLHSQTTQLHNLCIQDQRRSQEGQTEHQATLLAYLRSPHQSRNQIRTTSRMKHCRFSSLLPLHFQQL